MHLLDYTLNSGQSTTLDTEIVAASDVAALQDGEPGHITCLPPFEEFTLYVWGWDEAVRFTVSFREQQIFTCALTTSEAAGRKAWASLDGRCQKFRSERPELLRTDDVSMPSTVPFLATLWIQPSLLGAMEGELPLRFRNAVTVSLLRGRYFESQATRDARVLAEALARPTPVPCDFDPKNPEPWLAYQIAQHEPTMHRLAQRAMMIIYRDWLADESDVAMIRSTMPDADEPWCFWDTRTNRITESAGQPAEPGILAVRQHVANLCAEDELAARVLRLCADVQKSARAASNSPEMTQ